MSVTSNKVQRVQTDQQGQAVATRQRFFFLLFLGLFKEGATFSESAQLGTMLPTDRLENLLNTPSIYELSARQSPS